MSSGTIKPSTPRTRQHRRRRRRRATMSSSARQRIARDLRHRLLSCVVSAVLVTLCLASTVHGNQLGPVKSNPNAQQRPQAARRPVLQQNVAPDPLDSHLDRMFANFDEKNGKDDSLWDRLKRNFVEEDGNQGNNKDQLTRRTWWKTEGTLIKPRWLAKVYEAAIVGGKAIVKVINKEYPTHYLIHRVDKALDTVDRVPYFLDRLIPILDTADNLPYYLEHLVEVATNLRVVYPLLPRLERLVHQVERIDIQGTFRGATGLLNRVQNLPLERMVELLFNLSAEFKTITDLVKQAQALIPSLLPLFLGNRGGGGGGGGSRSGTTTTTESPVVFFPPLDDEEEEPSSGEKPVMMLVQFPPLDPKSTTTPKPAATTTKTSRPSSSGGGLASLDPAFLAKLKPEVISNINPAILGVLTPELIKELDADYLNELEPKVLKNLQPELLAKVDPKLLRSVPAKLLNALPEDLIRDFQPEFLEGLDPSFFANLDPALLEGLDAQTIRAFLVPDQNRRVFAVYPVASSRFDRNSRPRTRVIKG